MKFIYIPLVMLLLFVTACTSSNPTGNVALDEQNIEIKGSDTLLQLVSNMAEAYAKVSPQTRISVTGGGSGTGIAALINGEIDIADASRAIKDSEIAMAQERGVGSYEIIVARDMLSVIVNDANGVDELTMDEVGAIFRGEITNWKEVGGNDMPITLYGRQSTSGTYAFFMEHVLEGDYAASMRNMEGNQAILEAVKDDVSGIGYVGIGYLKDGQGDLVDGIGVVKISHGGAYLSPLDEAHMDNYPISRALYQYLAKAPTRDSSILGFIRFELSDAGQDIVEETGFVRLTQADVAHNREVMSGFGA